MGASHVLIIGAGITGLVLAQALKKHNVSFSVYERDPDPDHRGKGWALTLHWCLDDLFSLLPQHLIDRLPETYVDPVATANGKIGRFTFFNLSTGEALWEVPPLKRLRILRERLRRLLMEDIDVHVRNDRQLSPKTFAKVDGVLVGKADRSHFRRLIADKHFCPLSRWHLGLGHAFGGLRWITLMRADAAVRSTRLVSRESCFTCPLLRCGRDVPIFCRPRNARKRSILLSRWRPKDKLFSLLFILGHA